MVTLNAHFDGKVLVPDEPLALQPNQKVRISIEPIEPASTQPSAKRVDLSWLLGLGHTPGQKPYDPSEEDALWEKGYLPGSPGSKSGEGSFRPTRDRGETSRRRTQITLWKTTDHGLPRPAVYYVTATHHAAIFRPVDAPFTPPTCRLVDTGTLIGPVSPRRETYAAQIQTCAPAATVSGKSMRQSDRPTGA